VCGIAGFIQQAPPGRLLEPMLDRIATRGPDGHGQWTTASGTWHVALGHRRLAILDLAGGAQPMASVDGTACVTYNGEIYNFPALRRSLEESGRSFRTRSDTEVVLYQVAIDWAKGLRALNGMFAFAVWDAGRSSLLLARDRIGIKPLYYASLADGGVVFASELTSLLEHPRVPRTMSVEGLRSYFFSDYFHPPTTLVDGVLKLAPGHYVEWRGGRLSEQIPYWKLELRASGEKANADTLARELWRRLGRAVESQLVSDVPIGVFLSGGIDSSCVAALAQQRSSRRLKTFSIAFADPTFDESVHARAVAQQIGSEHVEERLGVENLLEVVDQALSRLDEPLADPSYLPAFLLSRLAASHVKVALGGDGGDELFAGYPTYLAHSFAPLWRRLPLAHRPLKRWVSSLREQDQNQSFEWKAKRFLLRWDDETSRRHLRWMSNLDLEDLGRAIPAVDASATATLAAECPRSADWLNRLLALDLMTYLPGSVLTKVDRASMAHGLEVRPPFLDNDLVEWVFSLPSSLKLRHGRSKYLLKLAAAGNVPNAIIHRPKKGFGIPLRAWLRGPLRHRVERALEPSALWATGALDRSAFAEWANLHAARVGDYSKPLWALIVLDQWVRRERVELRKAPHEPTGIRQPRRA
jgi:asparagine synthase (glutamine-hydrolysing)